MQDVLVLPSRDDRQNILIKWLLEKVVERPMIARGLGEKSRRPRTTYKTDARTGKLPKIEGETRFLGLALSIYMALFIGGEVHLILHEWAAIWNGNGYSLSENRVDEFAYAKCVYICFDPDQIAQYSGANNSCPSKSWRKDLGTCRVPWKCRR